MSIKTRRQTRLRQILQQRHPRSQEEIASMLHREGIEATQATLSRDLRELGVLKGPDGYTLPGAGGAQGNGRHELAHAVAALMLSAQAAGNLLVLRTGPGQAPALALELDKASLQGVAGTIAGDDTVFVASTTPRGAVRLKVELEDLASKG